MASIEHLFIGGGGLITFGLPHCVYFHKNFVMLYISIIWKFYSLRCPVNITFHGAATQLSHIFLCVVFQVLARYSILFDVHI